LWQDEKELIPVSGKNKIVVRIGGNEYTLVGVESDEYLQKVALYIDKKMVEIMKLNSRLSTAMASVLTAVNVADDYFRTYEQAEGLKLELKRVREEYDKTREANQRLAEENTILSSSNTRLQLELAKREAELAEVRNSMEKVSKLNI
jgi:cell division protein ZapA